MSKITYPRLAKIAFVVFGIFVGATLGFIATLTDFSVTALPLAYKINNTASGSGLGLLGYGLLIIGISIIGYGIIGGYLAKLLVNRRFKKTFLITVFLFLISYISAIIMYFWDGKLFSVLPFIAVDKAPITFLELKSFERKTGKDVLVPSYLPQNISPVYSVVTSDQDCTLIGFHYSGKASAQYQLVQISGEPFKCIGKIYKSRANDYYWFKFGYKNSELAPINKVTIAGKEAIQNPYGIWMEEENALFIFRINNQYHSDGDCRQGGFSEHNCGKEYQELIKIANSMFQ